MDNKYVYMHYVHTQTYLCVDTEASGYLWRDTLSGWGAGRIVIFPGSAFYTL